MSIGPEPSDRMEALLRNDGVADPGDANLAWKKLGKKHVRDVSKLKKRQVGVQLMQQSKK